MAGRRALPWTNTQKRWQQKIVGKSRFLISTWLQSQNLTSFPGNQINAKSQAQCSLCSLVCPNWNMLKLEWQNHVWLNNYTHAVRLHHDTVMLDLCIFRKHTCSYLHALFFNLLAKRMGFIRTKDRPLYIDWLRLQQYLASKSAHSSDLFKPYHGYHTVKNCWAVAQGRPSATTLRVMLERYWKGYLICGKESHEKYIMRRMIISTGRHSAFHFKCVWWLSRSTHHSWFMLHKPRISGTYKPWHWHLRVQNLR